MVVKTWHPNVVVAAIDGSDQSLDAARVAVAIAARNHSKLYLITVVRPPEGWWGIVGAPPPAESLSSALVDAQQAVIDRTIEGLDLEGVDYEVAQELGDPAGQIVAFCERTEADLLVIGQRGAGLVERLVVGSVADRVVHIATLPVLVVP